MLDGLPALQVASLGPVGGLSTSDTDRLAKSYPDGPQMPGDSIKQSSLFLPGKDAASVINLDSESYRTFYESAVMSRKITTSEFNEEVDLQYGLAPSIPGDVSDLNDAGEDFFVPSPDPPSAVDAPGSTIAPSGKGPNVNVTGFGTRTQSMIDAKPTIKLTLGDFVGGDTDPKASSSLIAAGGVHGGGIKGESNS